MGRTRRGQNNREYMELNWEDTKVLSLKEIFDKYHKKIDYSQFNVLVRLWSENHRTIEKETKRRIENNYTPYTKEEILSRLIQDFGVIQIKKK